MRFLKTHIVLLACFLSISVGTVVGQSGLSAEKDLSLEQLAWLAGHWEGEAFGGVCEEVWSPAAGGAMVGTFKLVVKGEVQFYEIMTITVDSAGPTFRLKHFNVDLTGWEEKDEVIAFPFKSVSDRKIEFEGLVYERTTEDSLRITVALSHGDAEPTYEVINCRKR